MSRQQMLGEEKISKLLRQFSIPAIIGMMVASLYNIVDRIFIGNLPDIGGMALAGVGLTLPISTIIMGFGMLIGIGTGARISLKLGQRKKEEAEEHLGNALTLIIIFSVIITIFGIVLLKPILTVFGATASTEGYAVDYMQIIFLGTIFNLVGFGLNHSIRSDGNPKVAMLSMLIGSGLNVILVPIFVFMLNLGVRGAAIATIISQLTSAIWIIYYFTKGQSIIKLRAKNLKLKKQTVISIFSIGMSPFSMQVALSLVQVVSNISLKKYGGELSMGASSIINSIALIFLMPIFGLNQGSQPIIGYNFGAKKYDRVKETTRYGIIVATIILTVGWIVIEAIPGALIRIFNSDPELVAIATNGLRIYLFVLPIVGFQIISTNYFQSVGQAKVSMILSLLRQVILLIPFLFLLPRLFNLGITGAWLAGPVSDFIASLITAVVFYKSIKGLTMKNEIANQIN